MFTPKVPVNDLPTGEIVPVITTAVIHDHPHAPTACHCRNSAPAPSGAVSSRPAVQLTPGSLLLAVGGGITAVLVVGAVLVSMLLAVAITAASLAVCAVVIRSLLNHERKN